MTDHTERLEQVADKLATTVEKLVLINERQLMQQDRIEKLEERVDTLRDDHNKWKNRATGAWAVVCTVFTAVTAIGWKIHDPAPPAPVYATPPTTHADRSAQLPARTSP